MTRKLTPEEQAHMKQQAMQEHQMIRDTMYELMNAFETYTMAWMFRALTELIARVAGKDIDLRVEALQLFDAWEQTAKQQFHDSMVQKTALLNQQGVPEQAYLIQQGNEQSKRVFAAALGAVRDVVLNTYVYNDDRDLVMGTGKPKPEGENDEGDKEGGSNGKV